MMMGRQRDIDTTPTHKLCRRCGRAIQWRRKWAKDWEHVRYCSKACRGKGLASIDHEIQRALLDALRAQRVLNVEDFAREKGWHEQEREVVRMAARRLIAQGEASLWQNGQRADPSTARGAFELRIM